MVVGLLPAALAAADLVRPPDKQLTARVLRAGVAFYQKVGSPSLAAAGVQCKFTPTCSRYADAVLARHGAVRGGWLALRRVVRCGPWTPQGTTDPPP